MSFMLRDRPDGQVEIVLYKPELVAIFPERALAERVCAFLQADDDVPELAAVGFATASADVAEAEADAARAATEALLTPPVARPVANLPAVVDRPRAPAAFAPDVSCLTEDQKAKAFARLMNGEKLARVAPDFGVSLNVLRAMWAVHRKKLQAHLAEGGQQACVLCTKPFIPSISHPDTCARCSHD